MLISDLSRWSMGELNRIYPTSEARSVFRLLAEEYLGELPSALIARKNDPVDRSTLIRFREAIKSLQQGVPVQYILGRVSFLGCVIRVGPGVLIPRPETEEMAMMIIDDLGKGQEGKRILDIGTGSACIPVALCKHLEAVEITGIDISEQALRYAHQNAKDYPERINLLCLDFLNTAEWDVLGNWDVIISNPPYLTSEDTAEIERKVLDHEPAGALFTDDSHPLIFYEQIIGFSETNLNPGGAIYMEINEKHGDDLLKLMLASGFPGAELLRDFRGKGRFIRALKPKS